MTRDDDSNRLRNRAAAMELTPDAFREIGHELVDRLADHLAGLRSGRVTPGETPQQVRAAIGTDRPLPDAGANPASIARNATELLLNHSLFNGHPRFFGYVTSSPTPIGAFGDFIAAVANPNVGAWILSPAATEIEAQTVRWIAEFIGYPADCGGLLVSGGNMANFVGFLAARARKGGAEIRKAGVAGVAKRLRCYCSTETHTWVQKAADISGLGTDSVRWIASDEEQRLDLAALGEQVQRDRESGDQPFLVAGTAGTVSTGAVDPLPDIADFCAREGLWFHVDGAYGGLAAQVPGVPQDLRGIALADSVAVDPHKWLYAPVEAGCVLVRETGVSAQRLQLPPAVLQLRRGSYQLLRPRAAELARVPGAQDLDGTPAGRARRLCTGDRRRHRAGPAVPSNCSAATPSSKRSPAASASARSAMCLPAFERA